MNGCCDVYRPVTRIYVACLASYNNGRLFGRWIDCTGKDGDDLRAEISAMLKDSPIPNAEEWAVHDHEGFAGLITSEWPDLDNVAAIAEVLNDDDDDKQHGLLWLVNDVGYSIRDALQRCEDVRTFDGSAADYACELAAEVVENFAERGNQWPFNCIDWDHAARELLIGGDMAEAEQDGERFIVTNAAEF